MRRVRYALIATGFLIFAGWTSVQAQEQTVGLFINEEGASEGFTLIAPLLNPNTYLIDMDGQLVHSWEHDVRRGTVTYLLENGSLLRTTRITTDWGGGQGGRIEEIDWDGNTVWTFDYADSLKALHHDVNKLPNGNYLLLAWELKSFEETVAAGHDPATLADSVYWPEVLLEVRPLSPDSGEIVWEWHVWDHLIQDFDATKANFGVVSEHPELVDINSGDGGDDWLHINAFNYNPELDLVIMSISYLSEFWVVDHRTTTEQATGHTGGNHGKGGDLLYRWGNPEIYKLGGPEDRDLFFNHSAMWIESGLPGAGNVLIFDNGARRPDTDTLYSTVYELRLPYFEDYDGSVGFTREADSSFTPAEVVWSYSDPGTFYSSFISGQQRLPNGNTLIDEGMTGTLFEVTTDGETLWQYVNPVVTAGPLARGDTIPTLSPNPTDIRKQNALFRAFRYPPDYPAFEGRDLTPKGPIEIVLTAIEGQEGIPTDFALSQNYPNPFNPTTAISFNVPRSSNVTLAVYNVLGQQVATLADRRYEQGRHLVRFDASGFSSGVYFYRLEAEGFTSTKTMVLMR